MQTAWVPLAPAKTQCFGWSSAYLENPMMWVGNLSLNSWYNSFKLPGSLFCKCSRFSPSMTETKSFFPRIQAEFGASDYMVRKTRELIKQKGILSTPNLKPGHSIAAETCESVCRFYESDEVSCIMPRMLQLLGRTVKTCTKHWFTDSRVEVSWQDFALRFLKESLSSSLRSRWTDCEDSVTGVLSEDSVVGSGIGNLPNCFPHSSHILAPPMNVCRLRLY